MKAVWRKGLARTAARGSGRRGGLFVLAVFLVLSGVIRIGDGVGHAFAESPTDVPAAAPDGEICTPDAGTAALLSALREREARLAEREAKAADHEQALKLAGEEIDAKLADLVQAEEQLAATIAQADQAADKDVTALVTMYETMKPKDAARLFGEMEPDFAAGFLARMRPDAGAAILAGLDPDKAYSISVVLAGRNAKAPKS